MSLESGTFVIAQFELFHLSVDDGRSLPEGRRLRNHGLRPLEVVTGGFVVGVHGAALNKGYFIEIKDHS